MQAKYRNLSLMCSLVLALVLLLGCSASEKAAPEEAKPEPAATEEVSLPTEESVLDEIRDRGVIRMAVFLRSGSPLERATDSGEPEGYLIDVGYLLAKDLGVAVNTVKAWLSVLEASYQVIVLRPYFANIGKRLVKTPKVYFTDVGTLCYLTGLKDPEHAASGPMGGPIMETAVLSEIVKTLTHRGIDPRVYFWRTSTGTEIDILIETGLGLIPIEVKLSATPRPAMASSIKAFQEDFGDKAMPGYVVHPGEIRLPLGADVTALPFAEL